MIVNALVSLAVSISVVLIAGTFRHFGRFSIYRKIVCLKEQPEICLQISEYAGKPVLIAPVWFEFINAKRKPIILRDIGLVLFKGDKETGQMKQVNHSTVKSFPEMNSQTTVYAHDGKHSVVIQGESVVNLDMLYMLEHNKLDFDRMLLRYFNARGKKIYKSFVDFPDGWSSDRRLEDDSWFKII